MRNRSMLMVLAIVALTAAVAEARTQVFMETNEDQFAQGHSDGVVPTSAGTLRLGRALENLLAETEGVDYVARLAEAPDGTVYAVTGGAGRIYAVKGGKVSLFATLEDHYLFSAAVDANGDLYVGSGGTKGRVWRVVPQAKGEPKAEVVYEADDVKYIWDLAWLKDGALAAATGDQGKLLRLTPAKKAEVLIDTEAKHVLCLAVGPDGALYAGTDGEALVYRWVDKKSFILFDADESEVTGLAVDAEGNLYVATSSGAAGRTGGVTIKAPPPSPPPAPAPAEGAAAPSDPPAETPADAPKEGAPAEAAPADAAPEAPAPPEKTPAGAALATAVKVAETMKAGRPASAAGGAPAPAGTGAAVYRITPEGLATPLFDARDDMVLALAVSGDRLLVGTGKNGRVYEVALKDEEQACLAAVDPRQVMALLVTREGQVLAGSAGPGRIYGLSKGYAKDGTYTSQVYDAGGSARWGAMQWRGQTSGGTEVRLATRSGNVRDPEKGLWSDWSKDLATSPSPVASPPARFLQVRVTMRTNREDQTPVLEQFEAAYLRANEPPKVLSVAEVLSRDQQARAQAIERFRQAMKARAANQKAAQGAPPPPPPPEGSQPICILQWRAEDPNQDTLVYDVYFRGQGEPNWILLESNLARPEYAWDTATVADGWYEVQVVASDRADHPAETACEGSKISDPILIDNTAPVVGKLEVQVKAGGEAEVRFPARDATSRLAEAAYTLDSATDWHTLAPTDGLFDGPQKEFRFTVRGLSPGVHRLAVRVGDEAGNLGHSAQTLAIPK